MDIPTGKVAVVAIVIAILVQGLGGFLANATTETSCESRFTYSTDVYGAFQGSDQDIQVDYNMRENITGYYQWDPDDKNASAEQRNSPAIVYDSPQSPDGKYIANKYPYVNAPKVEHNYSLTIEQTNPHDNRKNPEHYVCTLIEYTEEGSVTYTRDWSGGEITKWSGVYKSDPLYIRNSCINIQGYNHDAPRVINLYEIASHFEQLHGMDLSYNIQSVANDPYYPCFLANLGGYQDTSIFHNTYHYTYDSEVAAYCYYAPSKGGVEIHGQSYSLASAWLTFGYETDERSIITLDVISVKSDAEHMYIDPNYGVSPQHTETEYIKFYDAYYLPTKLYGDLGNASLNAPNGTNFTYKSSIGLGIIDPASPAQDVTWKDAGIITITGEGDGARGTFTARFEDGNGGQGTSYTWRIASHILHFTLEWEVSGNAITITMRETTPGIEGSLTATYHYGWLASGTVKQMKYTPIEQTHSDRLTLNMNLTLTDEYTEGRTPDRLLKSYNWDNAMEEAVLSTYQIEHKNEHIPFSSTGTYWYNGYNNSVIGMTVSCIPVEQASGEFTQETFLNLKLHLEDGRDVWIYQDPLKRSIGIWTDPTTKMVYVGHYDSDGNRDDEHARQVGVCEHVYLEFRTVNGALQMWVAPIYQFDTFMSYTASPMFDQSSALPEIYGMQVKSIREMSFDVRNVYDPQAVPGYEWDGSGDQLEWTSGDCTVYIIPNPGIIAVRSNGGDGRMADYSSLNPAPWSSYLSSVHIIGIGNGVTHIGNYAFYASSETDIISLVIPDDVETVGDFAFYGHGDVTSLTLGSGLRWIGDSAFRDCDIRSVAFPASVTTIWDRAFQGNANLLELIFDAEEWNVTVGPETFSVGTSLAPATVSVLSHRNCANGMLDDAGGDYTSFTYASLDYMNHAYPRHLVTKTVILLDQGGLYLQDGSFHPNLSYPNDALVKIVVNAVVHPGTSMTLLTDGTELSRVMREGDAPVPAVFYNDGTDKWIYNGRSYDWWELEIYYVSNHIGDVDIDGKHYFGKMYLPDGKELEANHVYVKAGKYGSYDDWGTMTIVDGRSDLEVRMDGIWAFSTQYYTGANIQGSHIQFDKPGEWKWSWNETLVVFAIAMMGSSIVLFHRYGFNIYDVLLMGGSLALLWVSFQG